jgi:hypothetical protein
MDDGLLDSAGYSSADDALYDQDLSQASSITLGRSQQAARLSQASSATPNRSQDVDDFSQASVSTMLVLIRSAPCTNPCVSYVREAKHPSIWSNVGTCTLRSLHTRSPLLPGT